MVNKRLCGAAFALVLAMGGLAPGAGAADRGGDYAVRGAGSRKCQEYVEAVEQNKPELGAYIAYIDGTLTAYNRLTPNVFDVSPFILPGPFAAIVMNICKQASDRMLEVALTSAIGALSKVRVAQPSPVLEMTVGENRMSLRAETLRAVQTRLKSLNLMQGNPDGRFGRPTEDALKRFQQQNRLAVTGLPDPDTVIALLAR